MNIELRLLNNGVEVGTLPDVETVTLSPVFCDYGALDFTYPMNGLRFSSIRGVDEIEVVPYINGVRQDRFGGFLNEQDGDDVAESGVFTFSGLGYLKLLDEGRVYPFNWPNQAPDDPNWKFIGNTAGAIMGALISAAKARGSLPGVTTSSFTNTTDSNGVAWTLQTSVQVKPGTPITDVLKSLYAQGMCEFEMVGRDLRMYVAGTMSVDRSAGANAVVFRRGRDLKDSPRKISSRDVATVMLAAGKEDVGLYRERVDSAAVAGRRRIEGYVSNGNITDSGTLDAFTDYSLAQVSKARMEKTHGLVFADPRSPQPVRDFNIGDWARSDTSAGDERLRIKQWTMKLEANGNITGTVVMNDLFAEAQEALARKLEGIVGGSTITGESKASAVPGSIIDGLAPAVPAGLGMTSVAYMDDIGRVNAQVSASWLQVTTNSDGTVCDDLDGYHLRWRYAGETGYTYLIPRAETLISWSPVMTNRTIEASVRAFDRIGNSSPWSANAIVLTGKDSTPPLVPAAPLADNYLGLFRVQVSTATASGAAQSPDLKYLKVHVSAVNNFTPDSTTLVDTLSTAGSTFVKVPYGETRYAKIVAVDHAGNESAPSAQASATVSAVVGTDIAGNVIGLEHIAFRDQDNLLSDGDFRIASLTAKRAASASGWSVIAGDDTQSSALRKGVSGTSLIMLDNDIPVTPGTKLMTRLRARQTGVNTTSRAWVRTIYKLSDGTTSVIASSPSLVPGSAVSGTWYNIDAFHTVVPTNAVTVSIGIETDTQTSGTWDFDKIEVRRVVGTALIEDAAIGNAQIANLAVNNAKIADLDVGKLTAGIMSAQVVISGRIGTASTGKRTELNGIGLQAWDASGNQTISLDGVNNLLAGLYKTALSGRRIQMGSAGRTGIIELYADTGARGYIRSYTQTGTNDLEAIQFGVRYDTDAEDGLWNRINFNTDFQGMGWSNYRANRQDFHIGHYNLSGGLNIYQTSDRSYTPGNTQIRLSLDQNFAYWDSGGTLREFITADFTAFKDGNGKERIKFHKLAADGITLRDETERVRLWIRQNNLTIWGQDDKVDIDITSDKVGFYPGLNTEHIEFKAALTSGEGVRIRFQTSQVSGGGVYVGWFKLWGPGGTFEFKNGDESGFLSVAAAAFNVSSDEKLKTKIKDFNGRALDGVRGTKVRTYEMKQKELTGIKLGLLAQEAPEEIRGVEMESAASIDLYKMASYMWAALQQLTEEFDAYRIAHP